MTELTAPSISSWSTGSDAGAALLAEGTIAPCVTPRRGVSSRSQCIAASRSRTSTDLDGVHDLLYNNFEHPFWDDVGARCPPAAPHHGLPQFASA
ncbi:MAG: hypothetical protein R2838_19875 [Caldilineaceae bacterium]